MQGSIPGSTRCHLGGGGVQDNIPGMRRVQDPPPTTSNGSSSGTSVVLNCPLMLPTVQWSDSGLTTYVARSYRLVNYVNDAWIEHETIYLDKGQKWQHRRQSSSDVCTDALMSPASGDVTFLCCQRCQGQRLRHDGVVGPWARPLHRLDANRTCDISTRTRELRELAR